MYMKFIEHENQPCILLKRECDTTVGCIIGIKDFKDFILFLAKKEEETKKITNEFEIVDALSEFFCNEYYKKILYKFFTSGLSIS